MFGLSGYFRKRAETAATDAALELAREEKERERDVIRATLASLQRAVKSADIPEVTKLIKKINELVDPHCWGRSWTGNENGLSSPVSLLSDAVYQDNVELFDAVFSGFDIDVSLSADFLPKERPDRIYPWKYYPSLLHFAIHERKKNIALHLASNPETKIDAVWKTGEFSSYREITPLQLARERNMEPVILVLAQREAETKSAELSSLKSEIKRLSPPTPAL